MLGRMPDRRVTDDMVTRALEVLESWPGEPFGRDLVRRALEDALLAPGAAVVTTEWGVSRWAERREHWFGTDAEAERVARAMADDHKKSGTPGALIRRTLIYGPPEEVIEP